MDESEKIKARMWAFEKSGNFRSGEVPLKLGEKVEVAQYMAEWLITGIVPSRLEEANGNAA